MNFRPASPPHSPAFAEGGGERRLAVEMKEPFRQSMVKNAVAGNGMTCREMEFSPALDPLSRQGEIQNARTDPRTVPVGFLITRPNGGILPGFEKPAPEFLFKDPVKDDDEALNRIYNMNPW